MNLYFLVEGKRTEKKVYPAWLGHLTPFLSEVKRFGEVDSNNYFIFSGEGYPSLLDIHLPNAIKDFKATEKYDVLVVALDVDESTPENRTNEVVCKAIESGLPKEQLRIIPQNCCIESWFLGNPRVISAGTQSQRLAEFLNHYNVRSDDPELMPVMSGFNTKSQFHYEYFKEVAKNKNFNYSKYKPGHVVDATYIKELKQRVAKSDQMDTLGGFFSLCEEIENRSV